MSDDVVVSSAVRPTVSRRTRPDRFVFLDLLRAAAVCLVMYSHVVGIFLHQHGENSVIAGPLQGFTSHPLDLALRIGNFGVVLFFLVSGFIVTHTGFAERPRQYAVKRLLRIYPMLAVSVLLAAVLLLARLHPVTTAREITTVTPATVLTNLTLANHLIAPPVLLVDVSWTLIIEVLFYTLLLAALPLLRRWVWPVICGELALVAVVMATEHLAGGSYFLLGVKLSYLPALLLGQVIWAVWSGRVPPWAGVVFGVVAVGEYVWGGDPGMGRDDHPFDVHLAIGFVLFVLALLAERRLRPIRLVGYLADRSYSLYLLHGLLGFSVLSLLYPLIGYPGALVAGVTATFLGAEAGYRWVERPSMRLARRLAKRWHATPQRPLRTGARPASGE
ncbi:MAG TPA: acyltransferase [Pseudonocardiaceae bacterium]|nr:acyltransferase [Pseudonocardiaceae bacterium]